MAELGTEHEATETVENVTEDGENGETEGIGGIIFHTIVVYEIHVKFCHMCLPVGFLEVIICTFSVSFSNLQNP